MGGKKETVCECGLLPWKASWYFQLLGSEGEPYLPHNSGTTDRSLNLFQSFFLCNIKLVSR